jgi:NAD(P)-dependent dehydrogenase (short-subunit alcohol dehydrogenase family)
MAPEIQLEGRVAVVTGCSRPNGIGRAIALALGEAGAAVGVVARSDGGHPDDVLEALADQISKQGGEAVAVRGDVGSGPDVARMVGDIEDALGGIDILVNNAAVAHGADRGPTWEVSEEAFDEVFRVNTKGVFLMSTEVVRRMLDRGVTSGRIVNIGSGVARRGMPNRAAYSASKAAVLNLTQSMATELGPRGITVNTVNPGWIRTDRSNPGGFEKMQDASRDSGFGLAVPLDRVGNPADIASVVAFLVGSGAGYITGQAINVDGGQMMT